MRFYISHAIKYCMPNALFRALYHWRVRNLSAEELKYARERVDYYVRIPSGAKVDSAAAVAVGDFTFPFFEKHRFSGYFFDLFELVRCFKPELKFNYLFGDINYEASSPTLVKSRPVAGDTTMSALVKLDSVRHFTFLTDRRRFADKKPMLVFRNVVRNQPHRTRFLELYHNHPLCDAGQVNNDAYVTNPAFVKDFMPIERQLDYKFICCIEGHDVATNLKWVMGSNSIAVMPKAKIESWFMEGALIPDYHYIEIRPDYTDLPEKLQYYIDHPDEAEAIIKHAHEYVAQFHNRRRERLIGRMVVDRYFQLVTQP